nr:MAG TPA: hypothetical protein [Caudoviricetes sp.]
MFLRSSKPHVPTWGIDVEDVGRCVFIGCEARKCVAPDFLYKGKDMR